MADNIREFLVSYGFAIDDSSRARAESATKAAEDRITAANAAAVRQRTATENKAQAERIRLAFAAGEQLTADDRRFVLEQEKIRIAASDADKKRQERDAKTGREHREETLKQIRATALKVVGVVTGLVTAIEGAAAGIFVATDKAAKSLEQLNYSAQLSGAAPKSIQAVVYALTQLGDSSDDAQKSLSSFGNNLEKYKAFEDVLKSMHIQTRDVNGQLRDTGELFVEYSEKLKDLPRAQREAMSTGWGVSEETIQAATRPGFRGRIAEGLRDQAAVGNDPDANAKSGTAFEQSARHLRNQAGNIAGRVTGNLFAQLQPQLDALSTWMDQHGDKVGEILDRIAADIIKLAKAVIDNLAKVDWDNVLTKVEDFAKGFDKLAKQFFGDEGSITVPFALFGTIIASKVLSPLIAIIGAMRTLSTMAVPAILATVLANNTIDPNRNSDDESTDERIMRNLDEGAADRIYGKRGEQLVHGPHHGLGVHANTDRRNLWQKTMPTWLGGQEAPASGAKLHGEQQKANAAAITDELNKAGLPPEGIAAALGSMQTESSLNPAVPENSYNHGHHGLIQWDSQRWPKVKAWIKSQGGDPWDVRWQTRAFVAEGRAKPGEALYNGPMTARGFGALENSGGDVNGAIGGMRDIERFGVGEEGGRGALARSLLPGVKAQLSAPPPASPAPPGPIGDSAYMAAQQRRMAGKQLPGDDALMATYRQQQATGPRASVHRGPNPPVTEDTIRASMSPERRALYDAMKAGSPAMNKLPSLTRPLGDTHAIRQSITNSSRGDTTLNNAPVFNVHTSDLRAGMDAARQVADRGGRDLLRNANSMEA